jgi:uncharacterized membrane protein
VVDALLRLLIQYAHVLAAVLWVGGGFYTLLVQLPALMRAAPAARGAVMAELAPRQVAYLLRVAEVTIATGVLNALISGRLGDIGELARSRWGGVIFLGAVLAVGLYLLMQLVLRPTVHRLLATGRLAMEGDATAGAELPAIVARLRSLGYAQLGVGALIVLLMVIARFS